MGCFFLRSKSCLRHFTVHPSQKYMGCFFLRSKSCFRHFTVHLSHKYMGCFFLRSKSCLRHFTVHPSQKYMGCFFLRSKSCLRHFTVHPSQKYMGWVFFLRSRSCLRHFSVHPSQKYMGWVFFWDLSLVWDTPQLTITKHTRLYYNGAGLYEELALMQLIRCFTAFRPMKNLTFFHIWTIKDPHYKYLCSEFLFGWIIWNSMLQPPVI